MTDRLSSASEPEPPDPRDPPDHFWLWLLVCVVLLVGMIVLVLAADA